MFSWFSVKRPTDDLQPVQINIAVLFWYLVKVLAYATVKYHTLDKSPFTRYQNNTAMYSWSPYKYGSTTLTPAGWIPLVLLEEDLKMFFFQFQHKNRRTNNTKRILEERFFYKPTRDKHGRVVLVPCKKWLIHCRLLY